MTESNLSCPIPDPDDNKVKQASLLQQKLIPLLCVVFLITSAVLGILLFNAQKQVAQLTRSTTQTSAMAQTSSKKELLLPAARMYTAVISLPAPKLKGTLSVEQAIEERRSQRVYLNQPLSLPQLSQMLWSGQGITEPKTGKRTAPSALDIYPFTMNVLVRNVTGLQPGLYEYLPKQNALGDMQLTDANAIFNNSGIETVVKTSPVVVILSAARDKGYDKMKAGAVPASYLEGGHIGQNMYLEAQSLKLGMVVTAGVGIAAEALKFDPAETVVYVIPIGFPAPTQ